MARKKIKNDNHKGLSVPAKFQAGFLAQLDGRTDLAKVLRANFEMIVADIGGLDEVSHIKASLVERFVWLEAVLQTIEHEMVANPEGRSEALGRWIQAVNSLTGLAKALGVDRKLNTPAWLEAPARVVSTNGHGGDK